MLRRFSFRACERIRGFAYGIHPSPAPLPGHTPSVYDTMWVMRSVLRATSSRCEGNVGRVELRRRGLRRSAEDSRLTLQRTSKLERDTTCNGHGNAILDFASLSFVSLRSFGRGMLGIRLELTVFDARGQRHSVKARAGQRLNDALMEHKDVLGDDFEFQSPNGCLEMDCHVAVANEWMERLPKPSDDELKVLRECTENPNKNSRLGSQIVLSKEMHRMVVALGTPQPWQTI